MDSDQEDLSFMLDTDIMDYLSASLASGQLFSSMSLAFDDGEEEMQ